jgi:hypothetical protein
VAPRSVGPLPSSREVLAELRIARVPAPAALHGGVHRELQISGSSMSPTGISSTVTRTATASTASWITVSYSLLQLLS